MHRPKKKKKPNGDIIVLLAYHFYCHLFSCILLFFLMNKKKQNLVLLCNGLAMLTIKTFSNYFLVSYLKYMYTHDVYIMISITLHCNTKILNIVFALCVISKCVTIFYAALICIFLIFCMHLSHTKNTNEFAAVV